MISTKTFYRKKNTQYCFLNDAISQIENDDPETAEIVMIGPRTGSEDSDMESKNEEILDATGFSNKVAGEVKVFQITSKSSCLIPTGKSKVAVNQQPKEQRN